MTAFNWKIAGAAGEGIKVSGLIFSKTCFKQGLSVHGYTEYPSLIRGGHNTFQVKASKDTVTAPEFKLDLLVCLNSNGLTEHTNELTEKSLILFDHQSNNQIKPKTLIKTGQLLDLPVKKLLDSLKAPSQMSNLITLGASCHLLGLNLKNLNQVIHDTFAKKGEKVINLNLQAAKAGFDYSTKNFSSVAKSHTDSNPPTDCLYLTGNDAISLGAISGGMKFFIVYPMTPATSILHFLAKNAKTANIAVRHAEDEIGVINMALGASFSGVRSMVATSGGGFSLMNEGLGLSGVTEIPLVIVNAMRPGPASGMPTWSGQGDLLFTIHASQDEFPRIVLTPGDPEEAFELSKLAQNLAEKYQLPIIILTDKYLAESYFSTKKFPSAHQNSRYGFAKDLPKDFNTPFKRYLDTQTGISPRSIPGQSGGVHLTNSYEHDELGFATEVSSERTKQVDKRNRKTDTLLKSQDLIKPTLFGPTSASTTLISWGSNKGSILQALKSLKDTNFIHFSWVWPFPTDAFNSLIKQSKKLVTLELNSQGQLNQLIAQSTGLKIPNQILKYDGRPFFPQEIIDKLKNL